MECQRALFFVISGEALRSKSAFSLVELIVVMVIISVMAIGVAFSLAGLGRHKLSGAANKLMSDIRYAQQLAISGQVSCGVSFDPSGDSYFVYVGDVSTKAEDPFSQGSDLEVDYDIDNAYNGVDLSSTNFGDKISFDYLGIPYDSDGTILGSTGIVTLAGDGNQAYVDITQNTGEVRVR